MSLIPKALPRQGYLYVARELHEGKECLKAGRSRQEVKHRERGLRAQTLSNMEIVRIFHTVDEVRAERIAFAQIDELGWRRFEGTRREQLKSCTLDEISKVLQAACTLADRETKLISTTRASNQTTPMPCAEKRGLMATSKLGEAILSCRTTYRSQGTDLGSLLTQALNDGHLFSTLERKGIVHRATTLKTLDIEVDFQVGLELAKYVKLLGGKVPPSNRASLQFKILHA